MIRLFYCCFTLLLGACAGKQNPGATIIPGPSIDESGRPMLAVWREFDGYEFSRRLRIAIWDDGRIIFCKDAPTWGTNLFEGKLTAREVSELKERIRATGVFQRSEKVMVEPDGAFCHVLLDFGTERQLLIWGEEGLRFFWNDDPRNSPKLRSVDFRHTWVSINRIALEFAPQHVIKFTNSFEEPPISWYPNRTHR